MLTRGRWTVALACLIATTPLHSASQSNDAEKVFDVTQLAPGVWAATVLPNPPMYVWANTLVVEQSDGLVVVDSHSSPSAADAMIAEIEQLSDKPVKAVINTHFHADHVYGNESYRERWPNVRFIAHENTARDVEAKTRPFMKEEMDGIPAILEQRQGMLDSGKAPSGADLTEAQIAQLEYSVRVNSRHLEELRTLDLIAPDWTFSDRMELPDAERPIVLLNYGPAHTEGDALVYLPEQKILAVGDLLEDARPWVDENTHPVGWAETLDRMTEIDADILFPSHGDIYRDREQLLRERDFFAHVVRHVRTGWEQGESLESIKASVHPESVPMPLPEDHPQMQNGWGAYVATVVEHTYRVLAGG